MGHPHSSMNRNSSTSVTTHKQKFLRMSGEPWTFKQLFSISHSCLCIARMLTSSIIVSAAPQWIAHIGAFRGFPTHGTSYCMPRYFWRPTTRVLYLRNKSTPPNSHDITWRLLKMFRGLSLSAMYRLKAMWSLFFAELGRFLRNLCEVVHCSTANWQMYISVESKFFGFWNITPLTRWKWAKWFLSKKSLRITLILQAYRWRIASCLVDWCQTTLLLKF